MKIFGIEIRKADRVVNESGTALVRGVAASMAQTAAPATGISPSPGLLPPATVESDPVRFQFPWSANQQYTPRSGYGVTPFSTLRGLASVSPEIFSCIQCRKDQMASVDWDFAPRDRRSRGPETEARVNKARAFFAKPDKVTPFKTWVQVLVDEVLTIDALSIYKRRTRGGGLYGYEIIDGSTIKVLLDETGKVPLPPNVAYRQIIYGAPKKGGDMTQDELIYAPKNVRTWSPYGMSPTEAVLLIVTSAINRQMFNLEYYTAGNVPEALAGVPDAWSASQIQAFNEYWNVVMEGDPKNRAKLRFVSKTMAETVHEFKTFDATTTWELWLLKVICACYGVTPSEIGFTDDVNRATSKSQGDVNQRRGVKPMAGFIKGILDSMLATDLNMPDLEATWQGGEGEDALSKVQIQNIQLRSGIKSLDEIRVENGYTAVGVGPAIITPMGPVFWTDPTPTVQGDELIDPTLEPTGAEGAALDAELKKYRALAIKAVKANRPMKVFTSSIITTRMAANLQRGLNSAKTVDDVNKVFGLVRKMQQLSDAQKKEQKALASKMTDLLAKEAAALATHLKDGVDGMAVDA